MSWLLGISGKTETVCPEFQGLENYYNNDQFSYPCYSACPPLQGKSYDSLGDSQVEDLEEAIPFSLNPRHSYIVKDEGMKNRIYAKRLAKHALELEKGAQEFQDPFYKTTKMPGGLSRDGDHSWTDHLPVHRTSRVLRTAGMAPCGSYDSSRGNVGENWGVDAFAPWGHASDPYLGYPEHTRGAEPPLLHDEAIGDRQLPALQGTDNVLKEENVMLRRVVRSMQRSLESQACTVQRLERQLKASRTKEERKARELQSFVQQTEWGLQLMTQRALEAERSVEKLKQEVFILQGKLESFKVENENLRAGQATDLGAVKHNIDFALQNLHKIVTGTNRSIRQLTSGAKSLHLVAEILKSTGKISEIEAEKEQ
ncbi:endosome-associated-trafficking regulator 1-like [Tyto alba]|uniref:endosome-associated-trafficking regulator 1-like n=1 Tax=Tyto alba TaxID=56313 RepID=UPI0014032E13|nr:endosome-associated-trafficking regulator 1-like [Tyto alba]